MVTKSKGQNRENLILPIAIAFLCGFLAGCVFTIFNKKTDNINPTSPAQTAQVNTVSQQQSDAIRTLESNITTNPEDVKSWTSLGHLYYDTDQPEKAIKAYTKVMDLGGGDANILTDLGIMYRRTNQPEKAVELFDQAIKQDALHVHSRLNKGIVLFYDLEDADGAYASWQEVLKIDPNTRIGDGTLLKDAIEQMKQNK